MSRTVSTALAAADAQHKARTSHDDHLTRVIASAWNAPHLGNGLREFGTGEAGALAILYVMGMVAIVPLNGDLAPMVHLVALLVGAAALPMLPATRRYDTARAVKQRCVRLLERGHAPHDVFELVRRTAGDRDLFERAADHMAWPVPPRRRLF